MATESFDMTLEIRTEEGAANFLRAMEKADIDGPLDRGPLCGVPLWRGTPEERTGPVKNTFVRLTSVLEKHPKEDVKGFHGTF